MTTIPILEVISFSTEHSINKVQNIVKNTGKWTNQTKNVSLRGKEIYEIQAEFKLPKCKIEAIDLGNCWSATIEMKLGRSGESISSRVPMFKTNPLILMTKLDCRNGANAEMMSFLTKPDLNPQVLDQHWDRLHVTCKQQHKNDVYFGLSTIVIRGKRQDQISLGVPKKFNFKETFKENEVKRQPDYYVHISGFLLKNSSGLDQLWFGSIFLDVSISGFFLKNFCGLDQFGSKRISIFLHFWIF